MGMKGIMYANALAMLAAAANPKQFEEYESQRRQAEQYRRTLVCGNCVHCPLKGKTFCKVGNRTATKGTPAVNCKRFERSESK